MADFDDDAADWMAEEAAELAQRETSLDRLKLRIIDLEETGRYADARRARELLGEATESIGFTRMRLQRELRDGTLPATAVSVQGEEAMTDTITVIRESERAEVPFVGAPGSATYRAIIGDDTGAGLPIRTGIQTSAPGYQTRVHSHPYVETLTVLSGRGEAWLDGEPGRIALEPGTTVVLPADRPHAFRAVGDEPLVTFGIHTFGKRIVHYKDAE